MTVFTHRGFSPHQFAPMSGAHKPVERTAAPRGGIVCRWFYNIIGFGGRALPAAVAHRCRSTWKSIATKVVFERNGIEQPAGRMAH